MTRDMPNQPCLALLAKRLIGEQRPIVCVVCVARVCVSRRFASLEIRLQRASLGPAKGRKAREGALLIALASP
jgi:hypothetical protein